MSRKPDETTGTGSCPACRSERHSVFGSVDEYRILVCGGCELAFAHPRPSPEVLAQTYSDTYFSAPQGARVGYNNYEFLPELNAIAQWPALLKYLGRNVRQEPGSLLDIGCATGGFLSAAQRAGWQVSGTDFSETAAARARDVHGVAVETGTLIPSKPTGTFDLVTMWHVLEHLVDPAEALMQLKPLVKADGVLFIELPNWNSLGRRSKGERWSQLRPPEHINFFNPRSLAQLAETCGYRVIRAESIYPPVAIPGVPKHDRHRVRARNLAGLALSHLGLGGYARLIATPLSDRS